MRLIVSTIGTSILTNLIDRNHSSEKTWYGLLRDAANLQEYQLQPETQHVLDTLGRRAMNALGKDDVARHRRISADLNGIYGVYDGQLPHDSHDIHYLVCTDTAQGRATGLLLEDFLRRRGLQANVLIPTELSTHDTKCFSTGIKALIHWCEETLPAYSKSGYEITFNLVGGFKSLQGYMNTIGMFYADAIVYIFEAVTADLIRIPRLPVQIDSTLIETHGIKLAMMAADHLFAPQDVLDIPDTLLEDIEVDGRIYIGLSAWGALMWNRTKATLLSQDNLLIFPRLTYTERFYNDFKAQRNRQARVKLQETLAKVAHLLEDNHGNTIALKADGALRYEQFRHDSSLCKFRVDRAIRVTCTEGQEGLTLRRYGQEEQVYRNP